MKTAIVITSRLKSERVPGKSVVDIGGKPFIYHLVENCKRTGVPVIVAVPSGEKPEYESLNLGVKIHAGQDDDPMARLDAAAKAEQLDTVVRVCHDKIFIDPYLFKLALKDFEMSGVDYLSSEEFIEGMRFEIMRASTLSEAVEKYKNVEHVTYAVRNVASTIMQWQIPDPSLVNSGRWDEPRLLLDFPEDLKLLRNVADKVGLVDAKKAVNYIRNNPGIRKINQLPAVTVYTCAYNEEGHILDCIHSVKSQVADFPIEHLIIDDGSTDYTPMMATDCLQKPSYVITLPQNVGLASASNIAISKSRGKYIMRLDADDLFYSVRSLDRMVKAIEARKCDVVYPDYIEAPSGKHVQGSEHHHVGGALFDKRALNFMRFTDKLRGYDGYDLFLRAREQLNIRYCDFVTFVYRQRNGSLSKTDIPMRKQIKKQIEQRVLST